MSQSSTNVSGSKPRDYYIDNMKGVFIYLVVFGHLLDYLEQADIPFAIGIRTFIYFFHMPGFIFLSGYLAKSFSVKYFKGEKLITYGWLYLLFKIAIELVHYTFDRPYFAGNQHTMELFLLVLLFGITIWILSWLYSTYPAFQILFMLAVTGFALIKVNIFYVGAAPWYLLSLILWYIFIYLTKNMKPKYVMIGAIVMAAVLDYQEEIGKFLSLSRTINFLPFFLLGFYMTKDQFYSILNNKKLGRLFPSLLLAAFLVIVTFGKAVRKGFGVFIYGVSSYEVLHDKVYFLGPLLALFWMGTATVLMLGAFMLCPKRKCFLTDFGRNSISIYVFHRLFKDILYYAGFYSLLSDNAYIAVAQIGLASFLLTILFGNRFSAKMITNLTDIKSHWFYRDGDLFYEEYKN